MAVQALPKSGTVDSKVTLTFEIDAYLADSLITAYRLLVCDDGLVWDKAYRHMAHVVTMCERYICSVRDEVGLKYTEVNMSVDGLAKLMK